MSIRVAGAPSLVENPAFAGLTIRVPLNKAPSKAWLDLLALQELPGKGHRLVDDALDFHLDRGAHDVRAAMRKIALAIIRTNATNTIAPAIDSARAGASGLWMPSDPKQKNPNAASTMLASTALAGLSE